MNYLTLGAALFAALLALPAEAACIKHKSAWYRHGYIKGCQQRFGWTKARCWEWANRSCATVNQSDASPERNSSARWRNR